MTTLVLEVHICNQRRGYRAIFEGSANDAVALAFIDARSSTHAFFIDEDSSDEGLWDDFPQTMDRLFPTCEHGMSAHLCMGPDHYPSAAQEMAWEIG